MITNFLGGLLGSPNDDKFVGIDIGSSSIKVLELDCSGERPVLVNAGLAPSPAGAIKNNELVREEDVASVIRSVISANAIETTKVVIAIPGPAVFTKKIVVAATNLKELKENIAFEARNYIPHDINAVKIDYQVLRPIPPSNMEVLLVAVKNEIVDSFMRCMELAELEPAIADVDYFALENMLEISYPEQLEHTVALVNTGARYSSVNIIQEGESLFTGDVAVGGRLYTDALCEALQLKPIDAEQAKMGNLPENIEAADVSEVIERTTEHIASELHRQIGFFWNAAATDKPIEAIFICGGAAQTKGLVETLAEKTKITCKLIDVLKGVDCSRGFDEEYLAEIAPSMGVSVGIASRRIGDKVHASEE